MVENIGETLQNVCLVCCLHKNLGKIYYNDTHSIIIDVLDQNSYMFTRNDTCKSSMICTILVQVQFLFFFRSPHFEILPSVT